MEILLVNEWKLEPATASAATRGNIKEWIGAHNTRRNSADSGWRCPIICPGVIHALYNVFESAPRCGGNNSCFSPAYFAIKAEKTDVEVVWRYFDLVGEDAL
jgi:hypothetical protein